VRKALAATEPVDWLIVDSYALDERWERQMRPLARKIMVIDDIADRSHDCDLLLDQNLYDDMEERYAPLVPTGCRLLTGPKYALLRSEFIEARQRMCQHKGHVHSILIFYGGFDESNETEKALVAIQESQLEGVLVDVVVGAGNPHRSNVKKLCDTLPWARFHCQVDNMAKLMADADMILGAGGATTWERCSLGRPALVTTTAVNQEEVAKCGARHGLFHYLGTASSVTTGRLRDALRVFSNSPESLQMYAANGVTAVDAKGTQRVAGILIPPDIELRRATREDSDSVFKWRNAEETRRHIFDKEAIPIETHRTWYRKSLENPDRVLLIGEIGGKPIGVLRYDITGDEALISVYLVPGCQGQGVGTQLICCGSNWLQQHRPSVQVINAEILSINKASLRAFEQAGYQEHHLTFKKVLQ
jgi:UDP-2,4-diacetamido-2,4,6-trideoxy-beta-L-altropyranose hydrolase